MIELLWYLTAVAVALIFGTLCIALGECAYLWLRALVTEIRIARVVQVRWAEYDPNYKPMPLLTLVYHILRRQVL